MKRVLFHVMHECPYYFCNNIDEKLLHSYWLRAVQLFFKLHIVQYCSAINKTRAKPGNEAEKSTWRQMVAM